MRLFISLAIIPGLPVSLLLAVRSFIELYIVQLLPIWLTKILEKHRVEEYDTTLPHSDISGFISSITLSTERSIPLAFIIFVATTQRAIVLAATPFKL